MTGQAMTGQAMTGQGITGQGLTGPPAGSGDAPPRIAGLDGLRAMAVLLVIATHAGLERVLPGGFGVTLFFFISGWLITGQLRRELQLRGRIDLRAFYWRRALRLLPAAWAFVAVAGGSFLAIGGHIAPAGWAAALGYGANYYDLYPRYQTDVPGVRHPFNILWSLAIEEHFYMLWPLLIGPLWRSRRAWLAVLALCVAILVWRIVLDAALAGAPGSWLADRLYKGSDTRLDSIGWGALAATLPARRRPGGRFFVQVAAAVLLAASLLIRDPWFRDTLRYTLQGAALLVLVPALLAADTWPRRALEAAPLVAIGRLSYALYLWHWLAMGAADFLAPHDRPLWLAIALPLSAVLALASFFGIERPMLALRRRAGSHAPVALVDARPQPAARRNGFVWRSSPKVELGP
jgi:peptidoglycan/LPS O-acetylase OafA/YrhL